MADAAAARRNKHRRHKKRRGGVNTHRVNRSLAALTVGMQRAHDELQLDQAQLGAGETEQQWKLEVAGEAGGKIAYQTTTISFDERFYPAADRRDSDFDRPIFTFGYEMLTGAPVMITAAVTRWVADEYTVTGAEVAIGIVQPGASGKTKFKALVHLVFQSWAGPTINDDEGG